MSVAPWCYTCFCVVLCVCFCTGHLVMVPLNLTYLNCNCCCCLFQELKLKDEECAKLLKVRDQIGEELEELTASLFEVTPHLLICCTYKELYSEHLGLTEWLSL